MRKMKKTKTHYEYHENDGYVPGFIRSQRKAEGVKPTLCGYTRKNTTKVKEFVTCFYCVRKLEEVRGK